VIDELKTPDEWAALSEVRMRGTEFTDWETPVTRQEWEAKMGPEKTTAVQKWADTAMFSSEALDATTGPKVHLLSANPDPLGSIAAMALMYKGIVVRDLADVTDDQRREMFAQIQQTKLKAPFEAVQLHWMVEGVTRSFTHQMVRQRTAVFAQESLRFAVVEDGFAERVALPPSLAWANEPVDGGLPGQTVGEALAEEFADVDPNSERFSRLPQDVRHYLKWRYANLIVQHAYQYLVNDGIPAEDARGLLPHNITTRLNYVTNLRNFQEHGGSRLCTQAQFEWRAVWIAFVQELRRYGATQTYRVDNTMDGTPYIDKRSSSWQFELIADMFRPACYLTGKCEFAAMDLDRKCSIRDRVDSFAKHNYPSSQWHLPLTVSWMVGEGPDTYGPEAAQVIAPAIDPREWLADPGAAR